MNADGTEPIIPGESIIDSRDVIARIEHLRAEWAESTGESPDDFELSGDDWKVGLGDEEGEEMVALLELEKEGADYFADWAYGETLVADDYFEQYAEELADDLGLLPKEAAWPCSYIDWERAAEALKMDYISIEFGDVTYWGRA
jgi:hypothetical protein